MLVVELISANNLAKVKWTLCVVSLLAVLIMVQGGVLLLAGGAVEYVNNTLRTTQSVPLDKAWTDAKAALKELQMPVTESAKDGASGQLKARNARNQPVIIALTRKTDSVTDVQITVGTFDSPDNRTEAQQIYDQLVAQVLSMGARPPRAAVFRGPRGKPRRHCPPTPLQDSSAAAVLACERQKETTHQRL